MLRPTNICVAEKNRRPRPEREEEYVNNIEMNIVSPLICVQVLRRETFK